MHVHSGQGWWRYLSQPDTVLASCSAPVRYSYSYSYSYRLQGVAASTPSGHMHPRAKQ